MEKQLRCKDCWRFLSWDKRCGRLAPEDPIKYVNPGQFACKKFVYKDK